MIKKLDAAKAAKAAAAKKAAGKVGKKPVGKVIKTKVLKKPAAAADLHIPKSMPYPGIPKKKPDEPMLVNNFKIYTDLAKKGWRAKEEGVREDKQFSWKVDAKGAWARLCAHVK